MPLPKILTLDLSTAVGWACGRPDSEPVHGTKVLPKTGADIGRFAYAYNEWLTDILTLEDPGLVVFEAPFVSGTGNATTARKLFGLCWQTEFVCHVRGLSYLEENNSTVKKFFAGHGHASKDMMIAAAERQGWNPKTDHEADALGLWALAVHLKAPRHAERFKLGQLARAPA